MFSTQSKSLPARERAAPTLGPEDLDDRGSVSPTTSVVPGLTMPAFSRGDVGERRAGELGVVEADVRDDRDLRVDHVRGVPPTEHPDLDHGNVDGDVGEPPEGRRRDDLEEGRAHAGDQLEVGDRADHLTEADVVDRLGITGDPLVDPLEVRAGVGADGQSRGPSGAG